MFREFFLLRFWENSKKFTEINALTMFWEIQQKIVYLFQLHRYFVSSQFLKSSLSH